ncbi:uncharacterized protein BDV14DRAFT_203610 [Aspergillus stella-maris]|uniref:uncharacterized protein n=1 Tax=Aspergillus stella-maris TaxID=1810926 RepID=UPI003CCE3EA7
MSDRLSPSCLQPIMWQLTPEEIAYQEAHPDEDTRPDIITASACGAVVSVVPVVARVIVRRQLGVKFGWDDYTIFLALAFQLLFFGFTIMQIDNGINTHVIYVKSLKVFWQLHIVNIAFFSLVFTFTKLSLLLLYNRVFPIFRWLQITSYIIGAIVIAYNVAVILLGCLLCIPLSRLWSDTPGRCANPAIAFGVLAAINVFTDIAILALPIKPVWSTQMSKQRRVQLLVIFLLGAVVCVFGIIRTVAMFRMRLADPSYDPRRTRAWSHIETSVGIAAACLPTLAKIFKCGSRKSGTIDNDDSQRSRLYASPHAKKSSSNIPLTPYDQVPSPPSSEMGSDSATGNMRPPKQWVRSHTHTQITSSSTKTENNGCRETWQATFGDAADDAYNGGDDRPIEDSDSGGRYSYPPCAILVRKDLHQSVRWV